MKITVTGATGLIGSHIVEKLCAQGHAVRALVRHPHQAEFLREAGAQLVLGDVLDPDTLRRAVEGVHTVYHCAALVRLLEGPRSRLIQTNVQGTRHMLEACVDARVQRFVFTSSVSVYGEVDSSTGVGEDHPHVPNSPYSESKIQSEKLVWQAYRERGLPVSILRPCVVYGPRDHHFSNLLLRNLNGRLPLIRNGAALLDLVHVHDVAEAHLLAGTSDSAVGQAYNVTDGERHTIRELVDLVGRLAHLPPHLMRVPYPLALGGAAVAAAFSALRGKRPLITPGTVRAMTRDHHYRIEKARAELGFVPKIKLEEGWRETVEWFKTHMK